MKIGQRELILVVKSPIHHFDVSWISYSFREIRLIWTDIVQTNLKKNEFKLASVNLCGQKLYHFNMCILMELVKKMILNQIITLQ